ncbi:MAG: branched-chain amino acid ABC transporter permease, partial [Variovorax sp.]|nr:branched-chain amino acid ABC transporter permease [Variovorax sp.]
LSFGHAVYSGLGGYVAIHVMNASANAGSGLYVPLVMIPLVGGVAGLFFGVLLGYITTKKSGTTFAMITMGMGELVYAFTQMFPRFFGGEGGITTNRSYGGGFLGLTFGPQIQVYYLIVAWVMLCTVAMYAFTQTPLGRIANAVRDNPERVEFIGYDTRRVRYLVLILSTFFAGISGGLAAINFEIVGAESVSVAQSGNGLLFTFIGGVGSFVGPILGAIAGGFLTTKLSDFTMAWQLYLGIFFILFVMYAPSGLAGIFGANWRVLRAGRFGRVAPQWLAVVAASAIILVGAVILVELSYALAFGSQKAATAKFLASLTPGWNATLWATGAVLFAGGLAWLKRGRKVFRQQWETVNADIAEHGRIRSTKP